MFNLSSWTTKRQPLKEWLVEELNRLYDVPRKVAQAWVDTDVVLPLLDGLDEVKQEHRAPCVDAINTYRQEHGLIPLVVCSRLADYEVLTTRLRLQGAVLVQPLSSQQLDAYLASAGDQLAALHAMLTEDERLRELAETPLMLSIMALAYQGRNVSKFGAGRTTEEQRQRLFDSYVERMLTRRGLETGYTREQIVCWLSWLACEMGHQSQSIVFIERFQPDWLLTRQERWRYTILDRLGGGLIVGLILGLIITSRDALVTIHNSRNLGQLNIVWTPVSFGAMVTGLFGGKSETNASASQRYWYLGRSALLAALIFSLPDAILGLLSYGLPQAI